MCNTPELLAILCGLVTVPAIAWSMQLQRSFKHSLRADHPTVWAELGTKGFFKYDESPKEAAVGWYLVAGQYHYLYDEELTREGNRARLVTLTGVAIMCLGMLATQLPTYQSVFACFSR